MSILTDTLAGATLDGTRTDFSRSLCAISAGTQRGGPKIMAKALLGHVGGPDPRMVAEMRRLQQRVRDLEAELVRLQSENDTLAAVADNEVMALSANDREPALT